nr:hypothetical protein CFP56_34877 [Quercus suber]
MCAVSRVRIGGAPRNAVEVCCLAELQLGRLTWRPAFAEWDFWDLPAESAPALPPVFPPVLPVYELDNVLSRDARVKITLSTGHFVFDRVDLWVGYRERPMRSVRESGGVFEVLMLCKRVWRGDEVVM